MKPRLRSDTLYLPGPEGVYLLSNRGTLTLHGRSAYEWLDRLAPYLDGTHSLQELTSGLSSDRCDTVVGLVTALADKGFIKDVTEDRPHTLTAEEERAWASEIAFIDYWCDSAAHRFQRFRDSRVLTIGAGDTLTALVHANLFSGLKRVDAMTTAECPVDGGPSTELGGSASLRDPRQSLFIEQAGDRFERSDAVASAIAPFDAVVHVSDRPMPGRVRRLNRACLAQGKLFVQAIVVDGVAWIGPITGADGIAPCWECAWRRLLGHRQVQDGFTDQPGAPVSEFLAGATPAVVANQLSFEVFKHLTGAAPPQTGGSLVRLDLATLDSTSHSVSAHPGCGAHGAVVPVSRSAALERMRHLVGSGDLDDEVFSRRAATCFDTRTGLFGMIDEHDFAQVPLKVSTVSVSDPSPVRRAGGLPVVAAAATDLETARLRATRRACEVYAVSAVDPRRFMTSQDGQCLAWGRDLVDGGLRQVRAADAFPVLKGIPPTGVPGLASGRSWGEAVDAGLLAQCERLTVEEAARSCGHVRRLDRSADGLTALTRRHLRVLALMGLQPEVYDVTGSLGVPTFAARSGDRVAAYASGFDAPRALELLVERVLHRYQAQADGRRQDASHLMPVVPDLPSLQDVSQTPVSFASVSGAVSSEATRRLTQRSELPRRLLACGWRAVAVPLDHDPVLSDVLPFIVNVVLVGTVG